MKFTVSASSLVFLLPLLAQVSATPLSFKGGVAGNNSGNNNKNDQSSAAASVAATAAASASAASGTAAAAASTASAATANNSDPQSSLTLDPKVVATGFEDDGQDQPTAGQVASLTSSNNFINFCLTVPNLPITNGKQITTGSCNPAPMGIIAATTNMPSSKFVFPTNGATIGENQAFTIQMAVANLDTGFFVNAEENYFSAPQQIGSSGNIQGHSHVVVEALSSMTDTTPTSPGTFAFFKGLNDPAQNGVLSADVTGGLPAGTYRLASINTAANHQPALVAIAQHGSLDDMVYFTVAANGTASSSSSAGSTAAAASATADAATAASSAAAAATASAAAGKAGQAQKGGNQNQNKGGNQAQQAQGNKGGNNAARPGNPFGGFRGKRESLKSRMH